MTSKHTPPAAGNQREAERAADVGHYDRRAYDSESRFSSYWHQIDAVLRSDPGTVLEVGVGNRFVSEYLRRHVPDVITVDLSRDLEPDICGSVDAIPVRDNAVDTVLCAEVLEHTPYDTALRAIRELARVARRVLVVTVPDATPFMRLILPIPLRGERRVVLRRWWARRPDQPLAPDAHYWELGTLHTSVERFRDDLSAAGLRSVRDYRPFGIPYHHIFVLKPRP